MPSVTIDPAVLSIPPAQSPTADIHRFVDSLLLWGQLIDQHWLSVYMSDCASLVLCEDGLFPHRKEMRKIFAAHGLDSTKYNVNTLAQIVDRLLKLTPSFETYFHIRDVLTEGLTTEPDILRLCSGKRLQSDLARCVVLFAILRHHCQEVVSDHSLILRRAPGRVIRVRAIIQMLEPERDDLGSLPAPPDYFDGDVLVCDDFRGLIGCLNEATILLKAANAADIETAIRIAVYKARLARGMDPDWDDVSRFRVGKEFLVSFQSRNPSPPLAANLLQSIVDTLEGTSMTRIHDLRTGVGGGNPQRVRKSDQAKAWRRDIDSKHHLHYWVCEEGLVELASMSFPHDDLTIPE